MISSASSSASIALLLAAGVALSGCAGGRAAGAAPMLAPARVAVFPPSNLGGGPAPGDTLTQGIQAMVVGAGLEVVPQAAVEEFLARHRIRNTGGVDAESAVAARAELGAGAILVTSVGLYQPQDPPRLALTMRLVSAEQEPRIVWIDGATRSGDDSPGLLDLGRIRDPERIQRIVLDRLGASLRAFLDGRGARAGRCEPERRLRPRLVYRSPRLDQGPFTVAVLPFVNESRRRSAGDAVALELVRQLSSVPAVEVVEPGMVREVLLRNRLIMPGGVSLDVATTLLDKLGADLVVAGAVRRMEDSGGTTGAALVDFSVQVLDRDHEVVAWSSLSDVDGADGVWLFDHGLIRSSASLLCRAAVSVVDAMGLRAADGATDADRPAAMSGRARSALRRAHGSTR